MERGGVGGGGEHRSYSEHFLKSKLLRLPKPVVSTFQGITEDASMFATPTIPKPLSIFLFPLFKTLLLGKPSRANCAVFLNIV